MIINYNNNNDNNKNNDKNNRNNKNSISISSTSTSTSTSTSSTILINVCMGVIFSYCSFLEVAMYIYIYISELTALYVRPCYGAVCGSPLK